MARFIDLEDEEENGPAEDLAQQLLRRELHHVSHNAGAVPIQPPTEPELEMPTRIDNAITQAFSCYP